MAVHYIQLGGFGIAEIREGADLLRMWTLDDMTGIANMYFIDDDIKLGYNDQSGIVFLTNSEYQVLVRNGNELDFLITLSWSGIEGTLEDIMFDLKNNPDQFTYDDLEDLGQYRDEMSESEKALFDKELESKS
jgi:hypothetical protein